MHIMKSNPIVLALASANKAEVGKLCRQFVLVLLLVLLYGSTADAQSTVFASRLPLRIDEIRANSRRALVCGLFELSVDLQATYDNPFDPEDVDVSCTFTSPTGRSVHINGFYYQNYTRGQEAGGAEKLTPLGQPGFRVRFSPDQAGIWRYSVKVRDRTGIATGKPGSFTALPSKLPGYVQVSNKAPGIFELRPHAPSAAVSNKPLFLVGENMCWSGNKGTFEFDTWLHDLAVNGGNFIRLWCSNGNTTIESMPEKGQSQSATSGYHGLGAYSLDHAWRIDRILEAARQNGIYTMLCLGTYGDLKTGGYFNEGQWPVNPYNIANGGPCATPEDFWKLPAARKKYQQKLRYFASRYGWDPHLHSWEFWNEAEAPTTWISEMADFLKGSGKFAGVPADPFRHLVSTTYGTDAIWNLPQIDFTMTHSYGTGNVPDIAPVEADDAFAHAKYSRPHFLAEFGIDWRGGDEQYDKAGDGINLHNGLWAGVASGNAGTAMLWYWDSYVAPKKLYSQFTAVRKFTDQVAWTESSWNLLKSDPIMLPNAIETFSDMYLPAAAGWGRSAYTDIDVTPLGIGDHRSMPEFLYGPSKPELRVPLKIHLRYTKDGSIAIRLNMVSDRSRLSISIDGNKVSETDLDASPPKEASLKPGYESTKYFKEYGVYQANFEKSVVVPVSAGDHTVTLDNTSGDWLSLAGITFQGYRSSRSSTLQIYGIHCSDSAVLWVHNTVNTWLNRSMGHLPTEISGGESVLHGLNAGQYQIRWIDTSTGNSLGTARVTALSSGCRIRLPSIKTDIAAILTRIHSR